MAAGNKIQNHLRGNVRLLDVNAVAGLLDDLERLRIRDGARLRGALM